MDLFGQKADFSGKKRTNLGAYFQKGLISDQGLIKWTYLAALHSCQGGKKTPAREAPADSHSHTRPAPPGSTGRPAGVGEGESLRHLAIHLPHLQAQPAEPRQVRDVAVEGEQGLQQTLQSHPLRARAHRCPKRMDGALLLQGGAALTHPQHLALAL